MITKRTHGIILRRINYSEADRIITLLTNDYGKIAVIAKGVRKEKSKLAGGIELFSESDIQFISGKTDLGTLVSTQLIRHFGNIHTDLDRMRCASEFLKRIDMVSENDSSGEFYDMTVEFLLSLNTRHIPLDLVDAWGSMRLMFLLGEVINVENDSVGKPFTEHTQYRFSFEDSNFIPDSNGDIEPNVIKFLRLLGREVPAKIAAVRGVCEYAEHAARLLNAAFTYNRPTIG